MAAAEQGIRKALLCACVAGPLCKADTARQHQPATRISIQFDQLPVRQIQYRLAHRHTANFK